MVQSCMEASKLLEVRGISTTVVDARFCKPLDRELMKHIAKEHEILITVEEGSIGGFGSHVSQYLGLNGLLDGNLKVIIIYAPMNQSLFLRFFLPLLAFFFTLSFNGVL